MLFLLALFQDVITTCYLRNTSVIQDVNTNLIEIKLIRNQTHNKDCQDIDQGVQINITINSKHGNLIPLVKSTVNNFSYDETNSIIIQNALDPVAKIQDIYYAQIDIYTYGKVLSVQTAYFFKQQSNLEECYYDNSVGNIYRDRVEITLNPTGICQLQMQTKSPGMTSYLESLSFQTSGVNILQDLAGFDYKQVQQTLIFYGNLIDTTMTNPFLEGKIVFNSNQGGTIIDFSHNILDMRLNTIPGFFNNGQIGMWNSKFYIKLFYDQSLYQRYLDVKGYETTFKMSIVLENIVYSFSEINNNNILQDQFIIIDCEKQLIQLKEVCIQIINGQKYDKLNLDIISLKQDMSISSMFKINIKEIQTCWNRAFGLVQKKKFKIDLLSNHECNLQEGQMQLYDTDNKLILSNAFTNNTYYQIYKGDFNSKLYTMVVKSNEQEYSVVIDQIQTLKTDYTKIIACLIGSGFIIYSLVLLTTSLIAILRNKKRSKARKNIKV